MQLLAGSALKTNTMEKQIKLHNHLDILPEKVVFQVCAFKSVKVLVFALLSNLSHFCHPNIMFIYTWHISMRR